MRLASRHTLRRAAAPLLMVGALAACDRRDEGERTTLQSASGRLVDSASAAEPAAATTHEHAAGPTAEPLILGPALLTAANLGAPTAVTVGPDGDYQVRVAAPAGGRDSMVTVSAETGTAGPGILAGPPAPAGPPEPAVDAHGRVYTAHAASGTVHVRDPAEGAGGARPLLTQLAAPAAVAVDRARGRLLVAEERAGRVRVYELP